jgi:hypothetical protein
MRGEARVLFSTGDGRLAMRAAEGWVLTRVTNVTGQVVQEARIALSELLPNVENLRASLRAIGEGAGKRVELFLGFTPEGDQVYADVTQEELAIVEVSADGVARRLLCGPYPLEEARRMAEGIARG